MTIIVEWDVKHQQKQTNQVHTLTLFILMDFPIHIDTLSKD